MVDIKNLSEVKKATNKLFETKWRDNFDRNRASILRSHQVKNFFGKFNNIPAIIVGAGPSLDKNIKYLKYATNKSIIVACDAALRPLLTEGITPSFVANLDPQRRVISFFDGLRTHNLALILPTVAHPNLIDTWKGKLIFYNKFAPDIPVLKQIQNEMPTIGNLTPGGTVLSIAYSFAFNIGANPITFVGQDLAYTANRVYSRETVYDIETNYILNAQKDNIIQDTDIFGKTVSTIKAMSVTKQWLDWAFSSWQREVKINIINSSEGGILRDHCQLLPLREFIGNYCNQEYNIGWKIKKLL